MKKSYTNRFSQMNNIVLITFDSLRFDRACPNKNMALLQKEGIFFPRAYAQGSFTPISIPSFLTGLYPSRLRYIIYEKNSMAILNKEQTISKILKQKGYTTAAIHSNPFISRRFGYADGYDIFIDNYGIMANEIIPDIAKKMIRYLSRLLSPYPYLPAYKLNQMALQLIRETRPPFFLWLHYMDTHGPYIQHTRNPFLQKISSERIWRKCSYATSEISESEYHKLIEAYNSEIDFTLENLLGLLDLLKSLGVYENTYFILTADHGDEFGEHGFYSHPRRLFDTLIHVPFLIIGPNLQKNRNFSQIIELTSIFPTVCNLVDNSTESKTDGCSLVPLIHKSNPYQKDFAISEASFSGEPKRRSIRYNKWKYIYEDTYDHPYNQSPIKLTESYSPFNGEYLFDIDSDELEQINLAREFPEVCKALHKLIENNLSKDNQGDLVQDHTDEDDEINKRLKILGYI